MILVDCYGDLKNLLTISSYIHMYLQGLYSCPGFCCELRGQFLRKDLQLFSAKQNLRVSIERSEAISGDEFVFVQCT